MYFKKIDVHKFENWTFIFSSLFINLLYMIICLTAKMILVWKYAYSESKFHSILLVKLKRKKKNWLYRGDNNSMGKSNQIHEFSAIHSISMNFVDVCIVQQTKPKLSSLPTRSSPIYINALRGVAWNHWTWRWQLKYWWSKWVHRLFLCYASST